ncbi:Olfactory receptor 4C45 [Sciurus carolinensis]|uniref:Olfactory receptor 4C45 n=1 Tax=Sciurus carolinensis TaxID=30640 RepID=A0AA41T4F3_SCICA|nr:Olfactory receptor 4C45 [Sciurus carolinensis]
MSNVIEFMLLGLTQNPDLQKLLLTVFLVTYVSTLVDSFYSSSIAPKMIFDLFSERNTISFSGYMTQLFAEHIVAAAEIILLMAMAYDRYVATCKPLHYMTIMK